MQQIRETIKKELKDRGISRTALARMADINPSTLAGFLLSNNNMSISKVEKLLDVLGLVIIKRYE